jgi:hypothetical protein
MRMCGAAGRLVRGSGGGNAAAPRTSRCAALVVVMPHTTHSWRSRGAPLGSSSPSPAAHSAASSAESALPKSEPPSLCSSSASPDQATQYNHLHQDPPDNTVMHAWRMFWAGAALQGPTIGTPFCKARKAAEKLILTTRMPRRHLTIPSKWVSIALHACDALYADAATTPASEPDAARSLPAAASAAAALRCSPSSSPSSMLSLALLRRCRPAWRAPPDLAPSAAGAASSSPTSCAMNRPQPFQLLQMACMHPHTGGNSIEVPPSKN